MSVGSTTVEAIPVQRAAPEPLGESPAAVTWRLVTAAQAGDDRAVGELWRIYHPVVLRFVRRRTYGDMHLADDIAADVWVRALRKLGTLEWRGQDFGAWLVTVARNLLADHYKSGRARREVLDQFDYEPDGVTARGHEVVADIAQAVSDRISNAPLLAALDVLTPDQREVVRLRFLLELDVAEVAALMRMNVGAVKALQYRAVRTLARHLPAGVTR